MFRTGRQLRGCSLQAKDGEIGRVQDLYFDTLYWGLRYFMVNAGKGLRRHFVLISPESVHAPRWDQHLLPVDLTQEQVRHSPDWERDQPVSRQYEAALRKHYAWPPYWGSFYGAGGIGSPPISATSLAAGSVQDIELEGDPHLFSAEDVIGHHVEASDGEIGHVDDLLLDDQRWTIRYLIIATRNWWPGKKVILSPWWASELDWSHRKICVDLKREAIKTSPSYNPEEILTNEASGELHDYYGRPRYPQEDEAIAETVMRSDNPNSS
jgi:hypothetical protein